MKLKFFAGLLFALTLALGACEKPAPEGRDAINDKDLHADIKVLASDDFQGRGPSTPGEEKATNFIRGKFVEYGVQPGNGDSYFQEVPLVDITATDISPLKIDGKGQSQEFMISKDMVALTRRVVSDIDVEKSPMVFVGYGIVAPEYGWNDYAGIDMHGKTAVILVNDPGYATKNPDLFKGFEMTYYGRWTYKYEEAMRQGADAAIIIHNTGPAGYPWEVVKNGWTGRNFYPESADGNMSRCKVEGWVTQDAALSIFNQAGLDYDALVKAAAVQGFKPVPMGLNASVSFKNQIGHSKSKNVIGIVPGSEHPDEYFIYMAHWDHLGVGDPVDGDDIYNGALDNASGSAGLLELAKAFGSMKVKPKRSIIFLSLTAEEQGLLGSQYYAENPIYPLNKTVAGLNMDGLDIIGPTRDITVAGYGLSELDGYLEKAAKTEGKVIEADPDVEKGYYYRSDHFNLAKVGVPMIYPGSGIDSVEHGKQWGQEQADYYVAHNYHKPSDEYDPNWDLTGAAQDLKIYFDLGLAVANSDEWPNWEPGTEFRAIRDKSLHQQ